VASRPIELVEVDAFQQFIGHPIGQDSFHSNQFVLKIDRINVPPK
jgi:hypothetical protein